MTMTVSPFAVTPWRIANRTAFRAATKLPAAIPER